jgi:hypothetical protein
MTPHMISLTPHLTSAYQVRRMRISVPLIEALIDNERYYMPDDLPPAAGEELRTAYRPRLTRAAPRAPSLRTMVRWVVKHNAEPQPGDKPIKWLKQRRALRQPAAMDAGE